MPGTTGQGSSVRHSRLKPCNDNLRAVPQAGLVKYATYVASDGGDFESEALGYFLIRESSSDEPGYLVLPGGQFVQLLPGRRITELMPDISSVAVDELCCDTGGGGVGPGFPSATA